MAEWSPIPTTYAGGAKSLEDLETVTREGQGRIHLTIGSALDIFGGSGVRYEDVVAFNSRHGAGLNSSFEHRTFNIERACLDACSRFIGVGR